QCRVVLRRGAGISARAAAGPRLCRQYRAGDRGLRFGRARAGRDPARRGRPHHRDRLRRHDECGRPGPARRAEALFPPGAPRHRLVTKRKPPFRGAFRRKRCCDYGLQELSPTAQALPVPASPGLTPGAVVPAPPPSPPAPAPPGPLVPGPLVPPVVPAPVLPTPLVPAPVIPPAPLPVAIAPPVI